MIARSDLFAEMRARGVYDEAEFDAWLRDRDWAWNALQRGDYGLTFDEAMILYTFEDPVRFAETYLVEPDTGDPYRLWDYQRESARTWRQDVVHQDGAELGKTREIVVLLSWSSVTAVGGTTANPWSLVAAPQQTHLDEIILAVEEQFTGGHDDGVARGFLAQFWRKPKRTPHTMHRFLSPNPERADRPSVSRIYYRPAGVDGEAFRGVHVNAFGFYDEAAKAKHKLHWSEFVRALKPGCRQRIYSVPDGDRGSEYYRICSSAVVGLPEGMEGFRKFVWGKSLMPPPFWSPEREREMVRRYGGRDTPGYKRNVLGEWGDAEDPVFRWEDIKPNLCELPEFRAATLIAEPARGHLDITVRRIELVRSVRDGEVQIAARDHELRSTVFELDAFMHGEAQRIAAAREVVRMVVPNTLPRGVYWIGADLGERGDPTEIIASEQVGEQLRDVLRIKAKGIPYHIQRALVHAVHELTGFRAFWGVDLGSAGTAVVKDLQTLADYADGEYSVQMVGFHFQNTVPCIDLQGEALEEEDEHGDRVPVKAPAKHWATQCIVSELQARRFAMAFDQEVVDQMTSHTARAGAKWPIYAKSNDHTIDARRMQMLVRLFHESFAVPDVFSAGTFDRRSAA